VSALQKQVDFFSPYFTDTDKSSNIYLIKMSLRISAWCSFLTNHKVKKSSEVSQMLPTFSIKVFSYNYTLSLKAKISANKAVLVN